MANFTRDTNFTHPFAFRSYFYQGALDIFNCIKVQVSNCVFAHNGPATIIKTDQYRGHSGGLSVGYNYQQRSSSTLEVTLSDNWFCNNTATGLASSERTTTEVLDHAVSIHR